jgi:hypothetical protein
MREKNCGNCKFGNWHFVSSNRVNQEVGETTCGACSGYSLWKLDRLWESCRIYSPENDDSLYYLRGNNKGDI